MGENLERVLVLIILVRIWITVARRFRRQVLTTADSVDRRKGTLNGPTTAPKSVSVRSLTVGTFDLDVHGQLQVDALE